MKLHEFLAASGNTKFFEERFDIWVHYSPSEDRDCERVAVNMYNVIKYAGYDVIYFSPDCSESRGAYITVGICAPGD